jgi:hypothetical protein
MMRLLLVATAVLAALWAGYWVVGSRAKALLTEGWAEQMRAQGWRIEWDETRLRGFPSRFDTTFEGLVVADPEGRATWQAPVFQLLSLSYRPNALIAVFPPAQSVAFPGGSVEIAAEDMRASALVAPGGGWGLRRATLVGEGVAWEGALADGTPLAGRVEAGQVAMRETAEPGAYDIAGYVAGLALPAAALPPAAASGGLPPAIDRIDIDATVTLRPAPGGDAPPEPRAVDLRVATLSWGPAAVSLSGALTVDAQGRPEGVLALEAKGWRPLVAGLALPAGQTAALDAFLGGMAGEDGRLETEVTLSGGQARIGLIPLGPVPRLARLP